MKRAFFSLLCFAAAVVISSASTAQEMDPEMMKKWQEFATPGEAHQALEYKVGKWKFDNKMWMAPDAPASESTGEAKYEMILGGRYIEDRSSGSFNGMPFEGRGLTGFNNFTKQYEVHWVDNFGTAFMMGSGTFDAAKKEWNYEAETTDPMTGKTATFRSVEKILDDDTWTLTMFAKAPDGTEFKSMEITYHRQK